jgi:hypothetical protein
LPNSRVYLLNMCMFSCCERRLGLICRSEQAYGAWFHNAGIVRFFPPSSPSPSSSSPFESSTPLLLAPSRYFSIPACLSSKPDDQILFAVLSTRFITAIRLGWGWVILILVACCSYYTLSIRRTRDRARDDMQRELVKTRLVTETESADWMNSFLERFWLM